MELAIDKRLLAVVSSLCSYRAPVNELNSRGDPFIWQALEMEAYNICDALVCY